MSRSPLPGPEGTNEQRRAERYPLLLRVDVHVAEAGPHRDGAAVVANMSRSGVFIATSTRAAVGQTVYFAFDGPHGECLAVGMVIANRDGFGFAVEFQGESMEMKAFFDLAESLDPDDRWTLLQGIRSARVQIV